MKIKNSLIGFENDTLCRLTTWCCKEIGLPVRKLKLAVFRNSKSAWGGCARSHRITVCVGPEFMFPRSCSTHQEGEVFIDRVECLVAITAHETYHVAAHTKGCDEWQRTRGYGRGYGSSERVTCAQEMRLLNLFRQNRESLLTEWTTPSNQVPVIPIQDQRAKKVEKDLKRWMRKLKLAQTKVAKLKRKMARYGSMQKEKRLAKMPQPAVNVR